MSVADDVHSSCVVAELMSRTRQGSPTASEIDEIEHASMKAVHATPHGPNTDITREKTILKEHEVIREGPGGRHVDHEHEEEIERDMVTTLPPPGVNPASFPLPPSVGVTPDPGPVRINPRTGKPLTLPAPLSLNPTAMSPIVPEPDVPPGSQMIRETHEEVSLPGELEMDNTEASVQVIHRPDGSAPVHTHTTTRTYVRPDGSHVVVPETTQTLGDPSGNTGRGPTMAPASAYPPTTLGDPNNPAIVVSSPVPHHTSEHIAETVGPTPTFPQQSSVREEVTFDPATGQPQTKNTSVSQTRLPPATTANLPPPTTAGLPPATTANNVPPKKEKQVWETNHPKLLPPATTANNIGTAQPGPGSTAPAGVPGTTASNVPPAGAGGAGAPMPQGPNDLANLPSQPVTPGPGAPGGGGGPAPATTAATPAPTKGTGSSGKGVHWANHLPAKVVTGPTPNTPK